MKKNCYLSPGNAWKYAFVAVVAVFIWTSVFGVLGQIKDNQRLAVSVYNSDCDTQSLRDDLARVLPELTDQEILELYVDSLESYPGQTYADDILTAQILRSDLVVMPESLIEQLDPDMYFKELPESLRGAFPAEDYYTVEDRIIGFRINADTVFSSYCGTGEQMILFFSDYSSNLGGIYGKGEERDDAALKVMYYLLEEDAK